MIELKEKKRPRIKPYGFFVKTTETDYQELFEVLSWIFINIGPYNESRMQFRTQSPWLIAIYFEHAADATAFKLRWG